MNNFPYFIPDEELELNVALLMIILFYLAKTKYGKLTLNNEKLSLYMFLLKNPVVLNQLLINMNKGRIELSDIEYFSVESISTNYDSLYNTLFIKDLLQITSAKNYLDVTYKKVDGFMYTLTPDGERVVASLNGKYFNRIKQYLKVMQTIQSEQTSHVKTVLNNILIGNKL